MAATDKISFGSGDTKVTNTKNNAQKAYVTGTTDANTNTGTQVFDDGVYITGSGHGLHCGILDLGNASLQYDSSKAGVKVAFK